MYISYLTIYKIRYNWIKKENIKVENIIQIPSSFLPLSLYLLHKVCVV